MTLLEKLQIRCRLCLDSNVNGGGSDPSSSLPSYPPFVPIMSSSLHDKLTCVFKFNLDDVDPLPKGVCHQCCTTVGDFYHFSEKVRQNQSYLQRMLVEEGDDELKLDPENGNDQSMEAETDRGQRSESHLISLEIVKLKLEPKNNDWEQGEKNLDDGENLQKDDGKDGGGGENVDDESDQDNDWIPGERSDNEGDKPLTPLAPRVKRSQKTTKRARKEGGYRSKSKEEIEEEDRKILEYFKFFCELCQAATETFVDLRKHFRDQHDQRGYHRCCNKKLFERCQLLEHIQFHLNPNLYGCDLCSKSFTTKRCLQLHKMQSHDTAVERPFKCDKCSKTFIQKGQLSTHLGLHRLYQCTKCDKVLAGKGTLTAHMVKMHSDGGRLICDSCGREFKSKTCFDRHVRKHMGLQETATIECQVCRMVLYNKDTLKKHMIAKHTLTDEIFNCNICGKQAPNKLALESHKRKVHCEEKYQCEFCDKRFKYPVSLKEHRALHTDETLYKCPLCPAESNSKANMYAHRKNVHPYEWAQEKMSKGQAQVQATTEQQS